MEDKCFSPPARWAVFLAATSVVPFNNTINMKVFITSNVWFTNNFMLVVTLNDLVIRLKSSQTNRAIFDRHFAINVQI
jgi:hypothetical protein